MERATCERQKTVTLVNSTYPIWGKKDQIGRSYWGVSHFWNMDVSKNCISNQDLSRLEWDGNEVHFGAETKQEVRNVLKNTIGILPFLEEWARIKIPTGHLLFASYDNGDMQIVDEGELPIKSITLRFWADRGNNSVINLSDFDNWDQPAIIVRCNFQ